MCNRSHQMHQFSFPLWNSSRDQHMAFVISSNALYISFIIIATNITIIRKISSQLLCHHYLIGCQCQCHVAVQRGTVSFELAIAPRHIVLQLTSSVHFIEIQRMFSIFLLSTQKEWVFNALKINTVVIPLILKQTNTFICDTVCVYAAAGDTFTSFPEVRWRKYDVRVTGQQCSIVCLFLSVQTSL